MFGSYFPAGYFARGYFPPDSASPPVPPAVIGFGPGWDLRDREIRRRKRTRDEIEATLRRLVQQATADPVAVAEVIAVVGAKAPAKRRAEPVDLVNWSAVMARTDAQLERLEDRLRDLVREQEDDDDAVLLLLGL